MGHDPGPTLLDGRGTIEANGLPPPLHGHTIEGLTVEHTGHFQVHQLQEEPSAGGRGGLDKRLCASIARVCLISNNLRNFQTRARRLKVGNQGENRGAAGSSHGLLKKRETESQALQEGDSRARITSVRRARQSERARMAGRKKRGGASARGRGGSRMEEETN